MLFLIVHGIFTKSMNIQYYCCLMVLEIDFLLFVHYLIIHPMKYLIVYHLSLQT